MKFKESNKAKNVPIEKWGTFMSKRKRKVALPKSFKK